MAGLGDLVSAGWQNTINFGCAQLSFDASIVLLLLYATYKRVVATHKIQDHLFLTEQ